MKKILFFILLTTITLNANAQSDTIQVDTSRSVNTIEVIPDSAVVIYGDNSQKNDSLGIFLFRNDSSEAEALQPSMFTIEKKSSGVLGGLAISIGGSVLGGVIGGIGGAVTGNVVSNVDFNKQRLVIKGHSSMVMIPSKELSKVRFRFYLPANQTQMFQNVSTANDFICVRLEQKKKKRVFPSRLSLSLYGSSTGNLKSNSDDIMPMEVNLLTAPHQKSTSPNPLNPVNTASSSRTR